jgi:hypothetical protein
MSSQIKPDNYKYRRLNTENLVNDFGAAKAEIEDLQTAIANGIPSEIQVDSVLSGTSTNPVQNKAVKTALDGKVDKVTGKQLSTEDYTTAEKSKLSGIATGADVSPVSSVNSKTGAVVLSASDVGADPTGAGTDAVDAHELTYDHDSFLTEAPVTSVNGLTGAVVIEAGGSSDVVGIRKLASVDGLTGWGSPSGAGLALSVSDVVAEKINGRFPYRLDATAPAAGTYIPLPITVTEFEAGSSTGLSLWVKPLTGYAHGYLEAVLYDPATEEILEPGVTLIRTGAHRHAWRVALNSGTSYQVWLRVTTAGGGQAFSLAFDDLRVAKDLVCGRWIWPFGGIVSIANTASGSVSYRCLSRTGSLDSSSSIYNPRWRSENNAHIRGIAIDAGRMLFTSAGTVFEISLVVADNLPLSPADVGALIIPQTTIVFTGGDILDSRSVVSGFDAVVSAGSCCTFVYYISIDTSSVIAGAITSILVEAD